MLTLIPPVIYEALVRAYLFYGVVAKVVFKNEMRWLPE